eukprot:TRINITY_DN2085_c0_g1_i2.p1 TRINITY_DN2085_c0_g1~~TRINITY_DN2085_c0_g1_i2.p1  ORF type:complete len:756 (-),score=165.41 TRINITY_DN2085_c0_g1_i2:132-2399(-)
MAARFPASPTQASPLNSSLPPSVSSLPPNTPSLSSVSSPALPTSEKNISDNNLNTSSVTQTANLNNMFSSMVNNKSEGDSFKGIFSIGGAPQLVQGILSLEQLEARLQKSTSNSSGITPITPVPIVMSSNAPNVPSSVSLNKQQPPSPQHQQPQILQSQPQQQQQIQYQQQNQYHQHQHQQFHQQQPQRHTYQQMYVERPLQRYFNDGDQSNNQKHNYKTHSSESIQSNSPQNPNYHYKNRNNQNQNQYQNRYRNNETEPDGRGRGRGYSGEGHFSGTAPTSFVGRYGGVGGTLMTREEIETVVAIQLAQIRSENPYNEDYYYQNLLRKKKYVEGNILQLDVGRNPFWNTSAPVSRKPEQLIGVLGKNPSQSIRAPRMVLDIAEQEGENAEPNENTYDSIVISNKNPTAITKIRKTSTTEAVGNNLTTNTHSILLMVERAFKLVLSITDIDHILRATTPQNVPTSFDLQSKRESLYEQRNQQMESLFEYFQLEPITHDQIVSHSVDASLLSSNPSIHLDISKGGGAGPNSHFVRLFQFSKGRRLVADSIGIFSAAYVHQLFLAFLSSQNLKHILKAIHSKSYSSQIMLGFSQRIEEFSFEQMTSSILAVLNSPTTVSDLILSLTPPLGVSILSALFKTAASHRVTEIEDVQLSSQFYSWEALMALFLKRFFGPLHQLLQTLFQHSATPATQIGSPSSELIVWEMVHNVATVCSVDNQTFMFQQLRGRMKEALSANAWASYIRPILKALNRTTNEL